MSGRVLFYVQHLLGVGHVKRAAAICRGMVDQGLDVTIAFGGMPVSGVSFHGAQVAQLPAVRSADAAFSGLVDEAGAPVTDAWWIARQQRLMEIYEATEPDLILVEHFPFGRRTFRRELLPLFERARAERNGKIVGSVRDVLVQSNDAAKTEKVIHLVQSWFDAVLVHGDPDVIPLDATFPAVGRIADLLRYTGYIVEPADGDAASNTEDGHDEVLVSAGGGAVGEQLFRTAHQVCAAGHLNGRTWRFLVGGNLEAGVVDELKALNVANAIIEPVRPDFPELLKRAALSISQAGYNTMMDLLVARCPAIVVPFATGGETEQTFRAEKFAMAGLLTHLPEAEMTVETLATAVQARAGQQHAYDTLTINLDGVAQTGRMIRDMVTGS